MKVQFDHELQSSFYLWFDDRLTRIASGVDPNVDMTFKYYEETSDVPSNLDAYYGQYRQIVSNGENVPSGVYINGSLTYQNTDPNEYLLIDFDQGRVILDPSFYGSNLNVTGTFSTKDFNVYMTNETEEELLIENTFILADDDETQLQHINNLNVDHYVIPAAFITMANSQNRPFAMGGLDQTIYNLRTVVLADSNYGLDAILSHFRDTKNLGVPILQYQQFPYGEFFHIKQFPYTYTGLVNGMRGDIWIEDVKTSKLYDRNSALKLSKGTKVGFIDFELNIVRDPRICS
jgi:hypothetical protein